MKKILLVLFCMLSLLFLLASCGEEKDITAETTEDTAEVPAENDIAILKPDNTTDYVIVYDDTLDIYSACWDLKMAIFNTYSINMFPKRATETAESEYEIIIGQTDRAESSKLQASNGIVLPYQIYIPDDMDSSKKYPVVLFMHGLGSVGTTGNHIYQATAQIVSNIPESKYKNDVIMIAPQHPKGQKWVEVDYKSGIYDFDKTPISKWLAAAKELVDTCSKELPIDTDRIYGYGNSMGAFATIYMAMTYPDLYAAIVPVAGGCDPTKAALIKDIPIWLFHGDADTTVNIAGSQTLYDNLKALDAKDAKLTVFKGVGHASKGCFIAAANTDGLLDWMFAQSK